MAGFADIIGRAPELAQQPGLAYSLSQSGADQQQVDATSGVSLAIKRMNDLKNQPDPTVRLAVWNSFDPATQAALTGAGVPAPQPGGRSHPGGIIGLLAKGADVISNVGDFITPEVVERGIGRVAGAVANVSRAPLGAVAKAANWGTDNFDHFFRATERSSELSNIPFSKIAQVWRETKDGKKNFRQDALDQLSGELDSRTYELALKQASGATKAEMYDPIKGMQPEAAAEYVAFLESPAYAKALQKMEDAHMGFGRRVARDLGLKLGSKPFHYASGTADALADFYADPIMLGAKAVKSVQLAKWGLTELAGVGRMEKLLNSDKAVINLGTKFAKDLNGVRILDGAARGKAVADLATRYPALRGFVDGMYKHGVTDYESYKTYLLDSRNAVQIMAGKAGHDVALMPHLTWAGEQMASIKGRLNVVDFLEHGHKIFPEALIDSANRFTIAPDQTADALAKARSFSNGYQGRWASMARRLSTKTATAAGEMDISHPDSWLEARKYAMSFLPKHMADQVGAAWIAADTEGRRTIMQGINDQLDKVAFNKSPSTRAWWAKYRSDVGEMAKVSHYSPVPTAGKAGVGEDIRDAAVLTGQFRQYVTIPSFKEMYAQASRVGLMDHVAGATGIDGVDKMMNTFKRNVLLRPALLFRNAGEEMVAHISVYGVGDYLKSRASLRNIRANGPMHRLVETMYGHVPDFVGKNVIENGVAKLVSPVTKTALIAQHLADRVVFGVSGGDKLMGKQAFKDAITEMSGDTIGRQIFDTHVSMLGRDMANATEDSKLADLVRRGRKLHPQVMRAGGAYSDKTAAGLEGTYRYRHALLGIADSPGGEGLVALRHIDNPQEGISALVQHIEAPEFKKWRDLSDIYRDNGAEAWATQIMDHTMHHVRDPQNRLIDEFKDGKLFKMVDGTENGTRVTKEVLDRSAVSLAALNEIPDKFRPASVVGRDWLSMSTPDHLLERVQREGFSMIGEFSNSLTRQPVFISNYVRARANIARSGIEADLIAQLGPEAAGAIVKETVAQRAMEMTLDAVDNDELRSQASVVLRNIVPFWRAQEEFYTRWARIAKHSPEAMRKAQLTMHGGRAMGWIKKDPDTGDDYFFFPTGALIRAANIIPGVKIPQTLEFTGKVRLLSQGLDPRGVLPSFSPIVAIPINDMARRFPELNHLATGLLGEQGAGRSTWDTLRSAAVPSVINKVLETAGVVGGPQQMASAVLQSVQYMDAHGQLPPDDATPIEKDKAMDRAHDIARNIIGVRALLGTFAPAAPGTEDLSGHTKDPIQALGLRTMKAEFQQIVKSSGDYTKALDVWARIHPDEMAFTQGVTQSKTVANVPLTDQALSFFKDHEGVARQFPSVFGFLIPNGGNDKMSFEAFRELQARGLRTYRSADEMYTALKVTAAMGMYQRGKESRDAAIHDARAAGDSTKVAEIEDNWQSWKTDYLQLHPQLEAHLADSGARADVRKNGLNQLDNMLKIPNLPNTKTADALRQMLDAYKAGQNYKATELAGQDDWTRLKRRELDANLDQHLKAIADSDAGAAGAYNFLFSRLD